MGRELPRARSQGSANQEPPTHPLTPPGLQNLHLLTLKQKYELRVDLEDFENNTASAKYAEFSISPNAVSAEEDGYTLYVAGFEDGGAGIPCCLPHQRPSGEKAGLALPAGPPTPSFPVESPKDRAGSHPGWTWALGEAVSTYSREPYEEQLLLFMQKPAWGGRPILPGCHVMPLTASLLSHSTRPPHLTPAWGWLPDSAAPSLHPSARRLPVLPQRPEVLHLRPGPGPLCAELRGPLLRSLLVPQLPLCQPQRLLPGWLPPLLC